MICLFCSMRVLPHHQDTGGFFIAVLEKKDWLPWQRKQRKIRQQTPPTETSTTVEKREGLEGHMEPANTLTRGNLEDEINAKVPKLKSLAAKAVESEELTKEVAESLPGGASVSSSVGLPESEGCENDGERTTQFSKMSGVESKQNDSVVGDGEGEKVESSDGQERPSRAVLGK